MLGVGGEEGGVDMLLLVSRDRETDLCSTHTQKKETKQDVKKSLGAFALRGNFGKKSKQDPKLGKKG